MNQQSDWNIQNIGHKNTLVSYNGNETVLIIPEGTEVISEKAFSGIEKLTSLFIPATIRCFAKYSFHHLQYSGRLGWIRQHDYRQVPEILMLYLHDQRQVTEFPQFENAIIKLLDTNGTQIGKLYYFPFETTNTPNFIKQLFSGAVENLSIYDEYILENGDIIYHRSLAAIFRLQFPLELSSDNKARYVSFLHKNARYIMPRLITDHDIELISIMGSHLAIPEAELDEWVDMASAADSLEIKAYLMDYKFRNYGQNFSGGYNLTTEPSANYWETEENLDGSLTITWYLGEDKDVTIPREINNKKVTDFAGHIGSLTVSIFFEKYNRIRSVVIEDGIQKIPVRAFLDCITLAKITLPASIQSIEGEAFSGCISLQSVVIPEGVTKIGPGAFQGCSSLQSMVIPKGVTNIHSGAFKGCSSLVIHTPKNSIAEKFAKEAGIKVIEL